MEKRIVKTKPFDTKKSIRKASESRKELTQWVIVSDGKKYMRLSEHMAMDVNTGKIHAISSWPKDK